MRPAGAIMLALKAATAAGIALGNTLVIHSTNSDVNTGSISLTAGQVCLVLMTSGATLSSSATCSSSLDGAFTAIGASSFYTTPVHNPSDPFKSTLFALTVASTGSHTITINDNGGGGFPSGLCQAYTNAVYDSKISAWAQDSASSYDSADITTNANTGWLVGVIASAQSSNPTYTAGNSFTKDVANQSNSDWTGCFAHKAYSGATTDHVSWTTNLGATVDAQVLTCALRQAP